MPWLKSLGILCCNETVACDWSVTPGLPNLIQNVVGEMFGELATESGLCVHAVSLVSPLTRGAHKLVSPLCTTRTELTLAVTWTHPTLQDISGVGYTFFNMQQFYTEL